MTSSDYIGLSILAIDKFIQDCGGRSKVKDKTAAQINKLILRPLAKQYNASYCELKIREQRKKNGPKMFSRANVYIRYNPDDCFLDVVDSIQCYLQQKGLAGSYLWLDVFSLNYSLYSRSSLKVKWIFSTELILSIGHTLVVTKMNHLFFLNTFLILWEIYSSTTSGFITDIIELADFDVNTCRGKIKCGL